MKFRYALIVSLAATTMLSAPVFAQVSTPNTPVTPVTVPPNQPAPGSIDPGHPRINQVQQRLDRQENWNAKREEEGKITEGQMQRDDARDQRIEGRLQKDEGEHGGHITKAEDRHLNHSMNSVHHEKERQMRHDRRERHERHEHHDHDGGTTPDFRR